MNAELQNSRQFFFSYLIINLILFAACTPKIIQKAPSKLPSNIQETKILKVDALGNAYVPTANTLKKYEYSAFGDSQLSYYENKYGDISSIDVSNPFQVLIWYRDFQMIQILDKHLTLLQEIRLQNLGLNISTVAVSGDKLIWLFDSFQHKLLKINTQKEIIFESNPIIFEDQLVNAKMMIEKKGFLYLLDKTILKFDSFAKQMAVLNAVGIDDFHFYNRSIILHNELGYSKMDIETGAIVGLDKDGPITFLSGKYLFILENGILSRNIIK